MKSKRLNTFIICTIPNILLFGLGMWADADLQDLGIGLAALNVPLYAYIFGESYRPSTDKKEENV